jgi:periplasmic protein TonB
MKQSEEKVFNIILSFGIVAFVAIALFWDHSFVMQPNFGKKSIAATGDFELIVFKNNEEIKPKIDPKPIPKAEPKIKSQSVPKVITNPTLQNIIEEKPQVEPEQVKRRVYGLKRVYSRGLGSGGGGQDAVVAKLGNSLDVPVDTILATEEDLKGTLVSVTKVSSMPTITETAKPEYTKQMKEQNISGKVTAKILVDVDGIVKQIIILKDLGYGTKEESIKAIKKIRFIPGTINGEKVAVWIPFSFRFEFQT